MMNMKDEKTEQMKEYLKLKKLQEEDRSDELIEEIYNEVSREQSNEEKTKGRKKDDKGRKNCSRKTRDNTIYEVF